MPNEFEFQTSDATTEMDNADAAETPAAFDCGDFLAELMIRSLVNNSANHLPHGLYIFRVKDDEWCSEIKQALWDSYHVNSTGGSRRRMVDAGLQYVQIFQLLSSDDRRDALHLVKKVQEALAVARIVAVIASNLTLLPTVLENASDKIFHLPEPNRKFLKALIGKIAPAARRVDFSGITIEAVTPAVVRLAYRRGTSVTAFIRRLQVLTAPAPRRESGKVIPLDRLHGVDEAKRWAADLKNDLDLYRQGQLPWHQISRGLLLAGEAGTGKTTLAASIATFCGLNFVATSYADWQKTNSGHLGDVLRAMTAKFTEVRALAPAILFIDELDTVGSRSGSGKRDDWWRSIINALLELLDGTTGNEGVIFIGATNHPGSIDPALLRSGRIEEHIMLRQPDTDALTKIYSDQLEAEVDRAVDLQLIARMSNGMTGADVVKTCTSARRRARNSKRLVSFEDLLSAISGGDERPSDDSQYRAAIHESGHAIVTLAFPAALQLSHVTVVGRGNAAGGTAMQQRTGTVTTEAAIDAYLVALLAGRAAEKLLLGEISAGSGGPEASDLGRATALAAKAELSFCMRDRELIWYPTGSAEDLARLFALRPDVAKKVSERLDRAYLHAKEIISRQTDLVRRLATQLVANKVMTYHEIVVLIENQSDKETLRITDTDPIGS